MVNASTSSEPYCIRDLYPSCPQFSTCSAGLRRISTLSTAVSAPVVTTVAGPVSVGGTMAFLPTSPYLDFDLQLTPHGEQYWARVLTSPAGQAAAPFVIGTLAQDLLPLLGQVTATAAPVLRTELQVALKQIGSALFNALFHDELLICLERSLDEARRQSATLRIKLRLGDVPTLFALPWEYLYHARRNLFLSQSSASSLVYYLELPNPPASLTVTLPLRMLVVIANPSDLTPLDVEREWTNLLAALSPLIERGLVIVDRLPLATLSALQQTLRRNAYHIFHFVGHGRYDAATEQALIVLVDGEGHAAPLSGEDLARLLHNERTLRLAVLNACEGDAPGTAVTATASAIPVAPLPALFGSIAQILVQQGTPAVIAMRHAVSDEAATTFAREFYAALADGYTVDGAVTEGRVAVATQLGNGEWGVPQLVMHASDGMLWQIAAATGQDLANGTVIGQDLQVLAQLMGQTNVRDLVATYRADFSAASRQIDLLSNYKALHDLLHKLQYRCYNVIVQEARRFPDDELALDNLLNYEVTLQDVVAGLHDVVAQSDFPANDITWIDDVVTTQRTLRQALEEMHPEPLRRVILLMRRILALQPSHINHRMNGAARALRLDNIVASLRAIHEALRPLGVESTRLRQLASGIEELRTFGAQLALLVDEHDQWQEVQRVLGRIEDMLVYDLSELEFSWPDLNRQVTTLCNRYTGDWVTLFLQDSDQLQQALGTQNPVRIRSYFQRYRQRAGNRFFQLDTELKDLCTELRKVGESLASILQLLE